MTLLLLADAWSMHDSDVGVGWMIVMMLGMILFWGFVILGVVWLVRGAGFGPRHHAADDPVAVLDRRLAEGELSTKEYRERRKLLSG